MIKQSIIALVGVVLVAIVGMMWLRVRSLETTVHALNQRLQSSPSVVTVGQTQSSENSSQQPVFKLIESATHNEHETNIGVPWDVERAMMGGAHEHDAMRGESSRIEVSPMPALEAPSRPIWKLDLLKRVPDSN